MPGYEPRTLHAMALGLAVNARDADHNRSGSYEADLSGDLDRLDGGGAHVAAAVETEDRAAVMDSLILCKFLRGVFTDPFGEWAGLLSAVTGWEVDGPELHRTARRIVLAKRVFNLRAGWQPGDDWLPGRLLSEPVRLASGREAALTPGRLRAMIDGYYAARGLDAKAGRAKPSLPTSGSADFQAGGYCIYGYHPPRTAREPSRSRSTGMRSRRPRARRSSRPPGGSASRSRCCATTSAMTRSACAGCAWSTSAPASTPRPACGRARTAWRSRPPRRASSAAAPC